MCEISNSQVHRFQSLYFLDKSYWIDIIPTTFVAFFEPEDQLFCKRLPL